MQATDTARNQHVPDTARGPSPQVKNDTDELTPGAPNGTRPAITEAARAHWLIVAVVVELRKQDCAECDKSAHKLIAITNADDKLDLPGARGHIRSILAPHSPPLPFGLWFEVYAPSPAPKQAAAAEMPCWEMLNDAGMSPDERAPWPTPAAETADGQLVGEELLALRNALADAEGHRDRLLADLPVDAAVYRDIRHLTSALPSEGVVDSVRRALSDLLARAERAEARIRTSDKTYAQAITYAESCRRAARQDNTANEKLAASLGQENAALRKALGQALDEGNDLRYQRDGAREALAAARRRIGDTRHALVEAIRGLSS